MSSNLPSTPPGEPGGPEYLDHHSAAAGGGSGRRGGGRRLALVAGGAAAAVLVAGGVWAATAFLAVGDQPAEALPASTLGYVSVDLDPSGGQKVEALRTLRKFPAFAEQVDLGAEDDLRELLFDRAQEEGLCPDLDYAEDVRPWVGHRLALAAVDTGKARPAPVMVLQVADDEAARTGLARIRDCAPAGTGGAGEGGWVVENGWAVFAETEDEARAVADGAADASLADDGDHAGWLAEVGTPGVVSFYVAPRAPGRLLAEAGELGAGPARPGVPPLGPGQLAHLESALADFEGMAGTVRFADGGLELAVAAQAAWPGMDLDLAGLPGVGDSVGALPSDTLAVLGFSVPDGYVAALLDQLEATMPPDVSTDDMLAELEAQTGLTLPEDLQTLLGESVVLAAGGDLDAGALSGNSDGSDLPVGVKITGDPAAIEDVLAKLRPLTGPQGETLLATDTEDRVLALGPNAGYRADLLADGDLAGSETYESVVEPGGDVLGVVYLDFDGADNWLVRAMGEGDPQAAENLEPLSAVGMSSWVEDDTNHLVLRLTTD